MFLNNESDDMVGWNVMTSKTGLAKYVTVVALIIKQYNNQQDERKYCIEHWTFAISMQTPNNL